MKKKLNERGLPSVGGVPHTDTSGQLGQARRPWSLTGATGGHSQSADSGFSSKLGRVNKGRDDDKYAYRDMFPENEEEEETEEDTYDKSIRAKISIDLRGRKPMPERKLTDDIDALIENNEQFDQFLNVDITNESSDGNTSRGFWGHAKDELWDGSVDVAGDMLRTAVGFIPGADIGFTIKNVYELKDSSIKGKELISRYHEQDAYKNLGGSYLNEIDDVLDDIITDLSDTVESFISILPLAGDGAGMFVTATSWIGRVGNALKPILKPVSKITKIPGSKTRIGKSLTRRLASNVALRTSIFEIDQSFESGTSFWGAIIESTKVAGTLTDIVQNFDELYDMSNDRYELMTSSEKIALIQEAERQGRLTQIPKNVDNISSSDYGFDEVTNTTLSESIAESKIRSLVTQILNEESKSHDCEKEHPNQTCAEWEEDKPDFEEHSIGGYTGPMASPANPKKFYKGMLDAYPGSHYVDAMPKSKA